MSPVFLFHRLPYLASARLNMGVTLCPLEITAGWLQQSDRGCKLSVHVQLRGPNDV